MARSDIRNLRTERAIKDALLAIMARKPFADASVSEVARAAGISRSTFYAHFENLEQVFESLVADQQRNVRTLSQQLHCDTCSETGIPLPFCAHLRSASPYATLVRDPHYLSSHLLNRHAALHEDEYDRLAAEGIPESSAQALRLFQLNGCYAAASAAMSDQEWDATRAIIDEFIRGGLSAVRMRFSGREPGLGAPGRKS